MKKIAVKPERPVILHCEKHGEYEERYFDWFGGGYFISDFCPACAEEQKAAEEAAEAERSKKMMAERLIKQKVNAGISLRNTEVKFSNFICDNEQMEQAKKKVYGFAKGIYDGDEVPSMILTGGVGTGKTMLACATMNAIIQSKNCRMVKMIDMFRKLKETWRKDSEHSELDLIKAYSSLDLLIIDEVGVNYDSDTEKMFIFDIIDGRYQNMKPTMLISNLSVDVIKEIIGERSYDRLRDGGGEAVAFDWESKRK